MRDEDDLRPDPEELLDRYAAALDGLAARYGLSHLRHGGVGTVIADVEPGRTLTDLARFEREAESLIGYDIFVMSSDAPAAQNSGGAPLHLSATA